MIKTYFSTNEMPAAHMKKLFLILLLFISAEAFPQTKLKGEYRTHYRWSSYLSFTEDAVVNNYRAGCKGRRVREGYYSIDKNILTLTFLGDSAAKGAHVVADRSEALVNTKGTISNRVSLAFFVTDKLNHNPQGLVNIAVITSKDTLEAITDWDGKA